MNFRIFHNQLAGGPAEVVPIAALVAVSGGAAVETACHNAAIAKPIGILEVDFVTLTLRTIDGQ